MYRAVERTPQTNKMADDIEGWSNLPEILKRLSSTTSSSSDEAWKKNFFKICYVITTSEEKILSVDNGEEESKFISQVIGLSANLVAVVGDSFYKGEAIVKKTYRVILLYCLNHLKNGTSGLLLSQFQLLQIAEGLLKFHACFSKDELVALQCKELDVPSTFRDIKVDLPPAPCDIKDLYQAFMPPKTPASFLLQDSLGESSSFKEFISEMLREGKNLGTLLSGMTKMECINEMASNYDKVFNTNYTSVKIIIERLSELSEELNLTREFITMQIMESLTNDSLNILFQLVESCLKAALFVASGYYTVDKTEVSLLNGTTLSSEDFCRKFGWKATEHSLAIFDNVSSILSMSPRLDNYISRNLEVKTVVIILNSLKCMINVDFKTKKDEVNSNWKWFEGLNIMLVTMTSRVILLLSNLADELKIEATGDSIISTKQETFDVFAKTGAVQRLQFILTLIPIPELLLDLFFAANEKGIVLSKLANQLETEESIDKSGKNKKTDNSSEEESSAEEGSMLGNFFVQSISDPDKTLDDTSSEMKKEDAFAQSGEIFTLLAGSLLDFTIKFFPICSTSGFKETITSAFSEQKITKLANLLKESDNEKNEVVAHVTKMLCTIITDKDLDDTNLKKFLRVLSLDPSQPDTWPLKFSRYVLSIFARVALLELANKEKSEKRLYATQAWNLFLTSLINAVSENNKNYVNVEYMQVLCLLFQLLPASDKKEIFLQCLRGVTLLAENIIVSPPHCSYLMLIFNFFIHHYSEPPSDILSTQVQHNVLSYDTSEEKYMPMYAESFFGEHEIFKNNLIKSPEVMPDNPNPYFYDVFIGNRVNLDIEATNLLLHSSENDYISFYYAFMKLTTNILAEVSDQSCDQLVHVLGTRNTFLRMWEMLKKLPVPATTLLAIKDFTELSVDQEPYLQYLKWMPYLQLLKEDIATINIAHSNDISEEDKAKELNNISNVMPSVSEDPNTVIRFCSDLITLVTKLFSCENALHFTPYMVADGLVMFLWLLIKKYVLEQKEKITNGEGLKTLLLDIIYLLQVEVEKSKELIIKQATFDEGDLSEEQFEFYMDIVGIDLPEPETGLNSSHETTNGLIKVLPVGFKEAMKKWNQLEAKTNSAFIPLLFHELTIYAGKKNAHIAEMITAGISNVVSSHLDITCNEPPFITYAASLKRSIRTLADICAELLPWMQENFQTEFENLKAVGKSTFCLFWVDHVASHISNHSEMLTLLCCDQPGQDKLEIVVFIRMLEVIDKWMVREIVDGSVVQEEVLISWMQFMGRLIDHTKTVVIFLQYFKQHEDSFYKIFKSAVEDSFSEEYLVAYVNLFTKLFNLNEKNADQNLKLCLLKLFKESEAVQITWIQKLILLKKAPAEGCALVRMFINFGIQNSASLEKMLSCLFNFCLHVVNKITSQDETSITLKFSFSNFFDVIVTTATACGELGHLNLLENALQWVIIHNDTWLKHISTETAFSNHIRECCNAITLYITKVVSTLSNETQSALKDTMLEKDAFDLTNFSDVLNDTHEDEDTNDEESDDDTSGKVCTFTITQRDYMNQHWYHCHTCKMSDGVGCCTVCAKVCHKGHDVTYSKHGSFFCDCGAKEDGSCKAMAKKSSGSDLSNKSSKNLSPFTAWGELTSKPSKKSGGTAQSSKHEPVSVNNLGEDIFLLRKVLKDAKGDVLKLLKKSYISDILLKLLSAANSAFNREVEKQKEKCRTVKEDLNHKMQLLYTQDKECLISDALMSAVSGSQEGAFENIKLNYGGDQGQTLRQLMLAHAVHHKAMCLIASPRGRRQHLAVAHEKGKVTILQLSGLLKQPEVNQKKMTLNRLSSTIMPFTVLHMASNPMNDDFLAVTGLKDCHILILGHSGSSLNHLALSSKLDTGNFIIKPIWVPGSQTQLALLTADFVKVYDLSVSEKEPTHHFVLPSGKARDATFIQTDTNVIISIMSSQGYIYTEVLNEASSSGPFYMMNVVAVNHPDLEDSGQELVNGGGVSVYYSHLMKLMFFSYNKGKTFAGVLDKTVSTFTKIFAIKTSITSSSPLIQWCEVPGQLGLIHCIHQNSGNVVVLAIKTDKILMQEIKSPSKSSKVQSAVCCHHSSIEAKPNTVNYRTTLIVLLDDGSLRIYNTKQDQVQFAQQSTYFPIKPRLTTEIVQKKETAAKQHGKVTKRNSSTKFPIDFFEHCHPTNDVEFGGVDVLHVYNTNQVKTRLNAAGMYIANTKPSGFKLEIVLTSTSNVMVGMRIQVGVQSMERSPQYVEFLGRLVHMRMAKNRWFDIPFTREESILMSEKNKLTVTFGPSSDPYGLSIVDSVKIYTKSKEAFGFPDEVGEAPSSVPETTSSSATVVNVEQKRPCSYSEILLTSLLSAINRCLPVLELKDNPIIFSSLLSVSANLLTTEPQFCGQPTIVSYQMLQLLRHLYAEDTKFYYKKDEIRISYMLNLFQNASNEAKANQQVIDIEMFALVLNIAQSVGNDRPENFVKFVEDAYSLPVFAEKLIETFWTLHAAFTAESNSVIAKRDMTQLSHLVEMVVEILFAVMLGNSEQINSMAKFIIGLLVVKDQCVSFAAKQGLINALQSRQKVTKLDEKPSAITKEEKKDNKEEEQATTPVPETSPEEQVEQQHVAVIEDANNDNIGDEEEDDDGIVIEESDIVNNENLQMLLDDDNAMMEIALALSLQNQNGENVGDTEHELEQMPLVSGEEAEEEGDDEEEFEEELEDEFTTDQDEPQEIQPDEVDEGDAELSDVGQESFSESPRFIETSQLINSTDKQDKSFTILWGRLLEMFKDKIVDLLELDGLQAIPLLQVLLTLCLNLTDSTEDKEVLRGVVAACVQPLEIQRQDHKNVAERNAKSEVKLVLMRFLSVLMSRCSANKQTSGTEENKLGEVKSFDAHVAQLLCEFGLIDHCLHLLKSLHLYWQNVKTLENEPTSTPESLHLLKIKPSFPTPDMMPFFMEQYVKSHALDLFEAFPQLVTEMILRVPYQIHKLMDSSAEEKYFSKDWTYILCEYMLTPHTPFVRRQVRKLLLALCGSKEKYRYVKDLHNLRSHLSNLRELLQLSGITLDDLPSRNVLLTYEETVSLTENINGCIDIAASRNDNWQSFCKKEKAILPFLVQASYQVNDHVSAKIIELIILALTSHSTKKHEKSEKKEKQKTFAVELIQHVFSRCFGPILVSFMKHFLLESNSTQLRWRVHDLIHTIYLNIKPEQQSQLIEQMWNLWESLPSYGHRASQFIDLFGFFILKTSHNSLTDKIKDFASGVMSMLKEGNNMLMKHPNASLYRKLQSYVELDGYYLESDPCVICNNPEVAFNNYKLSSLKSDVRYTTKSQIIKLSANHAISKFNLKISDIKRAKMVKTINLFYNNKPVPSVVELKNKSGIWQKAKKITLTQGQTEVKVELAFPITAYNLMIEFAEFYDNAQFSSETLQCPRCSASVPAHPGVCSNCGENVYQCHKCRAINYDERDPFLCTSCGFCKYAKFEFTLNSHPCTSVEAINNEEDRGKALKAVNNALDKADQYYQQLSGHRHALESLLKSAYNQNTGNGKKAVGSTSSMVWNISSLTGNANSQTTSSSAIAMSSINQSIQGVAQRYCVDCKTAFEEMSKVTQTVIATRKELAQYDVKQQETLSQALYASPDFVASPSSSIGQPSFHRLPSFSGVTEISPLAQDIERAPTGISKCYGCALSTVHHCLTLLRAFSTIELTHEYLLKEGLLQELIEHNLQQRQPDVVLLAQTLLIKLTSENKAANAELNSIICNRITLCLSTQAANMVSEISLDSELSVLRESIACGDNLWEERFRCVFKLFLDSLQHTSPDVMEAVTLPCLDIINSCMKTKQKENRKVITVNKPTLSPPPVSALKWLQESASNSFEAWKMTSHVNDVELRKSYLMKKYGMTWLYNAGLRKKQPVASVRSVFAMNGWLRLLLFMPSSRAMRQIVCTVLETLAESSEKKRMILHLLMSYLNELHTSGENAAEFISLVKKMLKSSEGKVYMCRFGILDTLCDLLSKEVDYLSSLESSTINFDLAQGYALNAFAELLKSFLEDEEVKVLYRGRFIAEVLQCYLALRKLVVQRTKLVDETQEILLALLRQLTSGTEESAFMKTCVDTLKKCPVNDIRTPVFIFEQLCNAIHKEEEETSEFFLSLEKDPQQEDFLQGRMQGNPYSSKESGLGPLMRDLKNKICTECELVALLEDDTGMELLVNNKIISLDLPVDQVYRKIWCSGKNDSKEPMKVIYRMRGLLGDATEDMIESLNSDKEEDVDEEHEYQTAGIMVEIGGLEVVLKRLSFIRDLSRAQQLMSVILKLLEYCVKVKVNRQYLNQPSVNAMKIMLATLNLALRLERDHGSTSGGAMIAERVLKIMEIILHEATTEAEIKQVVVLPGEESQLELLLNHISSPYVRSNPNVLQAMMRLTPFLTFGSENTMHMLIDHFMPFFDFESFDREKSPDAILHLDCFSMIASGISDSASGSKLKDLILTKGMVSKALQYLHSLAPPKSFRASGILDSAKWKDFVAKPSLPYILRVLTGLINAHPGTQAILVTDENVGLLHHLEQVSSEEMVGSLAENLMEALRVFPAGKKKVAEVRRQTRNEKKMLAMAMRQKQLESLGMEVNSSGFIKAKLTSATKEMEDLLEEKEQRMVCSICREGYKFYPNKVLGIYTYTSRCVLDQFENKPKRTQGYTTVSHFNVIHFDCHLEAVRHARSRDEWESAALQNGNTKCNGLLPLWGPEVSESSFASCLARHNNYVQESTGFREPTFHSTVHDIRLMLLRFAHQRSFSKETGGGGKHSNMYLLPYMIHIALYVLNTTRQRLSEEQLFKSFLDADVNTWIASCYDINGPLFSSVLSLFIVPLSEWKSARIVYLKRLLLLAHVRNLSSVPMNKLVNTEIKEYSVYKPVLMFFFLIDQLHQLCKGKLSAGEEDWAQAMSTFLRNNDDVILKEADKILKTFDEDVASCESFTEFCDVADLLGDIPDGTKFINDLLAPYSAEGNEVFC
ncbi:E3 ubiquitin-protein ligase UBR4-like isoform X1 [Hydractinia symbiolongicarpus]|uniref:E3 ubiquitin-protein ligase UBR4-like isoform X1 n=2 Tax=Hydractinia symbiolongicarpus TaxID=13093 RepID=UPI002549CED7|nr:E3 ubiquitin-protein ligase UBR4-like isoform X1 [Hydractinia symbiolongicarpus]